MRLQDVLQKYGVQFKEHGEDQHVTSGWLGTMCPHCGSSGNHFGFHLGSGAASCWKCGPHSSTATVAKLCGIDYFEAVKLLDDGMREDKSEPRPRGTLKLPPGVRPMQKQHKSYLARRRFDPEAVECVWGVKGIGLDGGQFRWRLFIPIRDRSGQTVSWTTRSLGNTLKFRYISAGYDQESVPQKTLLYGAELARHSIVIVEGPTDAWAIGPGAVATLGMGFSAAQLREMIRYPYRTVCFDSEAEAQRRAVHLCEELSVHPGTTTNVEMPEGDPASAHPDEIAILRSFID